MGKDGAEPPQEETVQVCDPILDPAFKAMFVHVMERCETANFHDLFCLMTDSRRLGGGDYPFNDCNSAIPSLKFAPARLGVRCALNATLSQFKIKNTRLGRDSGVAATSISTYRAHRSEFFTQTIQNIFNTLSVKHYRFFAVNF